MGCDDRGIGVIEAMDKGRNSSGIFNDMSRTMVKIMLNEEGWTQCDTREIREYFEEEPVEIINLSGICFYSCSG